MYSLGIILLEMCVPFATGMEVGEGRVKENEREKRERERERERDWKSLDRVCVLGKLQKF